VHLDAFVQELKVVGVLAEEAHLQTVDELLAALEGGTGTTARLIGRQHVLAPYGEDLAPLRDEGFAAYASRVARPYGAAVARHFGPERSTLTERGIDRLRREQ
jgi:hypothetical protein